MINNSKSFVLVEAVTAVVVVSVCLTLIAQTLLTNFRTGARFQESVRSLLAMENEMGLLYASNGAADQMPSNAQPLEDPYGQMTLTAQTADINEHLKQVQLTINWPGGRRQNNFNATTIIYNPDQVKTQTYLP